MTELDKLKDIYYDPTQGLVGLKSLIEKSKHLNLSNQEITDWYQKQSIFQLFKPKKNIYRKIICPSFSVGCLQADLIEIGRFSKQNKNFKFILNIIDLHSRFAWSFPLKTKTPNEIAPYFEQVFSEIRKYYPNYKLSLLTDNGNEFKGDVNKVIQKFDVDRYWNNLESTTKNTAKGVIERFNQTLWKRIIKYMSVINSLTFIDKLDDLVYNYNTTKHSTIKQKPFNVFYKYMPPFYDLPVKINPMNVGDYVRLRENVNTFDKKTITAKWTDQIYQIIEILSGNKYKLKNIQSGHVLKNYYNINDLLQVDAVMEPQTQEKITEKLKQNKREVNFRNKQLRDFAAPKHEVKFIDDAGKVVYKERLQPKSERRQVKKPSRLNL